MQDSPAEEKRKSKRLHLKPTSEPKKTAWTRATAGGIFGLASGLTAIIFACGFTLLGWLATPGTGVSYLQRFGTLLFLLSIPLLIFGAHCLDLQDRKTRPLRMRDEIPRGDPPLPDDSRISNSINRQSLAVILAFALLVLSSSLQPLQAQQTLFNVPQHRRFG